ncbi:MAG: type II toxin-antitoxin system VapC family toxin, partial [Dolichospermum sp.]
SPSINHHLDNLEPEKIEVCSVVKAELFYGSMRSNNPQKAINVQKIFINQFVSLPFNDECAEIYGNIRADLANSGTPISSNDIQIASITLVNNLTLVTHMSGNFNEFKG